MALEFGLLAPVLALILAGLVQVGFIAQTAAIARNAAREGASCAAASASCAISSATCTLSPTIPTCPQTAALNYLTTALAGRTSAGGDVTLPALGSITVVAATNVPGSPAGYTVTVPVTISINFPLMQAVLGATMQLQGQATMETRT